MSRCKQRAHIASDFQLSMQPIAHRLLLNPSSSKDIHLQADSIIQTLNWIPSWMPAARAHVHPPPPRQYRPPNAPDNRVAPT